MRFGEVVPVQTKRTAENVGYPNLRNANEVRRRTGTRIKAEESEGGSRNHYLPRNRDQTSEMLLVFHVTDFEDSKTSVRDFEDCVDLPIPLQTPPALLIIIIICYTRHNRPS